MPASQPAGVRRARWFTVIRIAVLGAIIFAFVLPFLVTKVGSERIPPETIARNDAAMILEFALLFRLERGRWPKLEQLAEPDYRGHPYLETLPRDPWDHDYEIRELHGDRCEVRSRGPDGEADTGDDIVERSH